MLRIGLTGGIASGKSTVAKIMGELGAVIIDADELARVAVEPGTPGLPAIIETFGRAVLSGDGTLDRDRLGEIVFADAEARAKLESIIHPEVKRLAALIETAQAADAIVVHVIPLLVETGQAQDFDLVVVVDVDPTVQLDRLVARSALTPDLALARINSQASREQRLAVADRVIDNNGDLADLKLKTHELMLSL